MEKITYRITVQGCDDSTVFDVDLTDDEYETINKIAKQCTDTSEYDCMPIMKVEELQYGEDNGKTD